MDQYTTNINDLPIDNNPPENRDFPEKEIQYAPRVNIQENIEKKVSFQEKIQHVDKTTLYDLKESNKIIILASLIFLLFSDSKVKNYILNILIGIFGENLKTTNGGVSKLGLAFYASVYGLVLYVMVNIIDIILQKLQ
jgi:hypothetical protein